jgi:ABC-type transport system involved in cytochrome c biogenesis ATPase subunit
VVNSGDILRITGTNGSGKTSLLKILAGLSAQEQGTIHLDDHPVKSEEYPLLAVFTDTVFNDFNTLRIKCGKWLI